MLNETQIPAPRVPIAETLNMTPTREWFRFFNYLYEYSVQSQPSYGAFHDETSPTWTANTPTLVPLGVMDFAVNMTDGASRINIERAGLYTITASFQLTNSTANEDEIIIWLRVNGLDVPATSSVATVPKKHGSDPGSAVLTVNYFYEFVAGDYFELYGLSKLGYAQIISYPASVSPPYPAAPGTILTVAQIK